MPFDPDQYLQTPSSGSGFDPDAYLASAPAGGPRTWSSIPGEALSNVPGSAWEYGKDIAQAVAHPFQTGANLAKTIGGGVQMAGQAAGLPGIDTSLVPGAQAVAEHYKKKYGSVEGFKEALATDPVGTAGDLSMLFTGPGGAAARLPGVAGKIGNVVAKTGSLIDPLTPVVKGAELTARGAVGVAGGMTGTGGRPATLALETGLEGGSVAPKFREELRGTAAAGDVVNEAMGAVGNLRDAMTAKYQQDIAKVGKDKTILSWNDIDTTIDEMNKVGRFGSTDRDLYKSTKSVRNKITKVLDEWKDLRASEHWTPAGFDAMKKEIGDIVYNKTEPRTPARRVGEMVYNSIKNSIVKQVPEYKGYMEAYEKSLKLEKEMQRTLSLNPDAPLDTSLRKLQSLMRNNVTTAYGRRAELGKVLEQSGAPDLMPRLAGSALSSWAPRGLAAKTVAGGSIPAALITALSTGGLAPLAGLAALPFTSPRIVGELAHGAGRLGRRIGRPLSTLAPYLRQGGDIAPEEQ